MNENFNNWAKSFSGCDGGNIEASIWVSGIEWGFGKERNENEKEYEEKLKKYYETDLVAEIHKGSVSVPKIYNFKESLKYKFGEVLAKLLFAIMGKNVSGFREIANFSGQEIFKLNLYPIAFPKSDESLHNEIWKKYKLNSFTGIKNDRNYKFWCFYNRFPFLLEQLILSKKGTKSKLIICTGTDSIHNYCSTFILDKYNLDINEEVIKVQTVNGNDNSKKMFWIMDNNNLIVIVPFFSGRNGLNSDILIEKFGKRIKDILEENKLKIDGALAPIFSKAKY